MTGCKKSILPSHLFSILVTISWGDDEQNMKKTYFASKQLANEVKTDQTKTVAHLDTLFMQLCYMYILKALTHFFFLWSIALASL